MTESTETPRILALREIVEERKGKAIETLSSSYAKNKLPLEEYERLAEYINKIESERELIVVEKIVAEYKVPEDPADSSAEKSGEQYAYSDQDDDSDDSPDYDQPYQNRPYLNLSNNMALFSNRSFSGPLKTGSQFVSIFGNGDIRIRKADLLKRQTFIDTTSIFGNITVFVESGINVMNKAVPIMGNSDINGKVHKQAQHESPELIINGAALFGNISVRLLKDNYKE